MNGHGGARPGAGRRKGGQNRTTQEANAAARQLPYCTDPLDWLKALMADAKQPIRLRVDAARTLLRYTRPGLMHLGNDKKIKPGKLKHCAHASCGID